VRAADAQKAVIDVKRVGKKIGIVPTMGALHDGHLSLVEASVSECDYTVVTIFVNPIQFGPHEDLTKYPRDLDKDHRSLERCGVDLVFAPTPDEIYAPRHSTYVSPPSVADRLEGVLRPGHFQGVATIVLKLFNIIPADVAYFGQKDYQQSRVVVDMVADLNLPISIQVCPTLREHDGLAMSSRNVYLSPHERQRATGLSEALNRAAGMFRDGEGRTRIIIEEMRKRLYAAGVRKIEYVEIVDPVTLEPLDEATPFSIALIAAYVGKTRLIDNMRLG
jgi:pantoate--beta-alanine ligase